MNWSLRKLSHFVLNQKMNYLYLRENHFEIMTPSIKISPEKKLIGKRLKMTYAENKTFELWSNFMPRRNEITNKVNNDFISMQIYDESFDFVNFSFTSTFEKWASIEVTDFNEIPNEMEKITLIEGLYAVFIHIGDLTTAEKTFRYIFEEWLPNSEYILDNRPHFEILGAKYKKGDPTSEEEIWIPIKTNRL
jgi:AraC family transcriptional regulator